MIITISGNLSVISGRKSGAQASLRLIVMSVRFLAFIFLMIFRT